MGKYFGREPRYSREEIERQAQEAIDARVGLGRPPAEEWAPLQARLAEIDQVMAARPPGPPLPVPEAVPMQIHEVRMPRTQLPAQARTAKAPAGARLSRRMAAATPATD